MKRTRNLIVQGLALLLITGAALIVCWLAYGNASDPGVRLMPSATRFGSKITDAAKKRVTYRFLYPDEPGGVTDKLRLARFLDGHLCESMKWDSLSVDHWQGWAADIFAREMGWIAKDQPGWLISSWLCADECTEHERDSLFWSIQALRFLDPETTDKEIHMIEGSGKAARIYVTQGCSDYNYCEDTLYWNPTGIRCVPVDKIRGERWFITDPLIALARQLSHMRHDFCQNGDSADGQERENMAMATELRIREILSRKDPTRPYICPKPGH